MDDEKETCPPPSLLGSKYPLIQTLECCSSRNLATQDCQTVQDCLRKVAKTFPARPVTQLLLEDKGHNINNDENVSSSSKILLDTRVLRVSFGSLLTGPLKCIQGLGKGVEGQPPDLSVSTRSVMQHLILVFDFLQLLLELYRKINSNNANESKENTRCLNVRIMDVKETDLLDIIEKLLRALVGVLCGSLENATKTAVPTDEKEEEDDKDDRYVCEFSRDSITDPPFQPRLVAYFGWHFLLRLKRAYIPTNPKCLNHFWKAFSELTSAITAHSRFFPAAMTHEALKDLVWFLGQGTPPILQSILMVLDAASGKQQQQSQLQPPYQPLPQIPVVPFKMLSFFLGRTQFFLQRLLFRPETDCNSTKRTRNLNLLLEQLSIWKGIDRLLLHPLGSLSFSAVSHELNTAAEKAQRCLDLLDDKATGIVRAALIPSLPKIKSHEKDAGNKETASYAAALGKSGFLLHVMIKSRHCLEESTEMDSWKKMEDLLKLIRALIFQALPVCLTIQQHQQCSDPKRTLSNDCCDSLLSDSVPEITQALGVAVTFAQQPNRIHRLIVSWLGHAASKGCHPLTREVLLVIVVQTILEQSNSDAVRDWMYLMVQLLLDARTLRPLRAMMSTVLRRFFTYCKNESSSLTPDLDALRRQVGYWLVQGAKGLAQQWQPTPENTKREDAKKRKRIKEPSRTSTALCACDLHVIGQVLLLVSSDCELQQQLQELRLPKENQSISKAVSRNQLLLNALSIYCNATDSPSVQLVPQICSNRFRPRTTSALDELTIALLIRPSSSQDESTRTMKNSEFQSLLELSSYAVALADERRKATLLPAVILLLGSIGSTVPPNPSDELLNRLSKTCRQTFASCFWYQTAFCVSSIDQFSRHVPERYKHKLPMCIPSAPRTLMTCRYQKKPYIPVSLKEASCLEVIQRQYHQHLSRLCRNMSNLPRSVFPHPSSLTIPDGSYIISMPTRDGRSATVIFDPSEASLEDIAYMLDGGENEAGIRQLKQVIALEHGGCKLFLHAPT